MGYKCTCTAKSSYETTLGLNFCRFTLGASACFLCSSSSPSGKSALRTQKTKLRRVPAVTCETSRREAHGVGSKCSGWHTVAGMLWLTYCDWQ